MALDTLGRRLRAERETRGLTIEQLSASTKIPVSLLEALERDDFSRWPKGLYRRAFFRSYVTAVGLRPEPFVAEFARLFPDEHSPAPSPNESGPVVAYAADTRELTVPGTRDVSVSLGRSVLTSVLEVMGVLAAGTLVAWAASMDVLAASGAVALIYYPVARAGVGRGWWASVLPGRAAFGRRRVRTSAIRHAGETAPLPARHEAAQRAPSAPAPGARLKHPHASVTGRYVPPAVGVVRSAGHVARRTAIRISHTSRRGAQATGQLVVRVSSRTSDVLSRGAIASTRVLGRAAGQANRLSSRAFETASQAFWKAIHAAAEQAELVATRRLKRTRD